MKQIITTLSILLLVSCSIDKEPKDIYTPVDGVQGESGYNSLVKQTKENDCVTFDSGLDINRNNELDDNEITYSNQLCSIVGEDGLSTLLEIEKIDNCLYVLTGLDSNRNGVIDANEITFKDSICSSDGDSGEDGDSGFNTLVRFDVLEIGSECENGGTKINYGLDINRDNTLQDSEIQGYTVLCNVKCIKDVKCKYIVYNTTICNNDPLVNKKYSVWLDGKLFSNIDLRFRSYADGSVRLWGQVARHYSEDLYTLDVTFNPGEEDDYKNPICIDEGFDPNDWQQFTSLEGTFINNYTGETFILSRRGIAAQMGLGADTQSKYLLFGLDSWMWASGDSGNHCKMDINIILVEECH